MSRAGLLLMAPQLASRSAQHVLLLVATTRASRERAATHRCSVSFLTSRLLADAADLIGQLLVLVGDGDQVADLVGGGVQRVGALRSSSSTEVWLCS